MTLWTSALRMKTWVGDNHNVYWSADNRNTDIWLTTGSCKISTDWRASKMSFLTKGRGERRRIYRFEFMFFSLFLSLPFIFCHPIKNIPRHLAYLLSFNVTDKRQLKLKVQSPPYYELSSSQRNNLMLDPQTWISWHRA